MTRRVVEKLCTKKVCVDFLAPNFWPQNHGRKFYGHHAFSEEGKKKTWRTFRIFFIFSARGRGKGESEALEGGGGGFLLKILEGGLPGGGRGEGPGGPGRVCAGNWAKYFFSGPKSPPRKSLG